MAVTLNLVQGQNLTLTPQLRQAIAFLQLPTLELNQVVAAALENNPLLESAESEAESSEETDSEGLHWENTGTDSEGWDAPAETTLTDFLLQQLHCLHLSDRDRALVSWLIGCLDSEGFLPEGLEGAAGCCPVSEDPIEPEEWRTALSLLQSFEPAGVGAVDTKESLLLQLKALRRETDSKSDIFELGESVIQNYLPMLAKHKYEELSKLLACPLEKLRSVLELIGKLTPHPAAAFSTDHFNFIVPELEVYKHGPDWRIRLLDTPSSRVRLNKQYAQAVLQSDDSSSMLLWKDRLNEARELLRNIEQRRKTLLKVAEAVLSHQKSFFDLGPRALQPLVLRQIAEETNLHESTVSRACSGKYMLCPAGIFELKYFFSSSLSTSDGENSVSSSAVKSALKRLIDEEDKNKPLSDAKLAERLASEGFSVARRTIAKYREGAGIAPASERKKLK